MTSCLACGGRVESPARPVDGPAVPVLCEDCHDPTPTVATDGGTPTDETEQADDLPDLDALEEGDEVRVFYTSNRSGNEVSREGRVETIRRLDDGDPIAYVHTEHKEALKHVYCALIETESKDGDPVVAAYSVTTEPDGMSVEDTLKPGQTYVFTQSVARTQLLGAVDRLVPQDPTGGFLVTDGGTPTGDTDRERVSVLESMEITAEAEDEYDVCPECGEEYIDLDTTLTGTLVFIHQENPLKDCTLDTDTDRDEEGSA